jgi:adenylate cyclase
MIELEKTFLAKTIPDNLQSLKSKEIIDIYIPKTKEHPKIRIRKNGSKFELTKKEPVDNDPSVLKEQNINLTQEEFNALNKLEGKRVHKIRYYYPYKNHTAELDVFLGNLKGLVLVDFEFTTQEKKDEFIMPDFCLADVTPEKFIAGGMLCGKSYEEIEENLKKFNYKKL